MKSMRQIYSNLYDLNRDLLLEHTKRTTNHTQLLKALRTVNHMIQNAARLRVSPHCLPAFVQHLALTLGDAQVGPYKQQLVSSARKAIKGNNEADLIKLLSQGEL
jgi:hypothetical protein